MADPNNQNYTSQQQHQQAGYGQPSSLTAERLARVPHTSMMSGYVSQGHGFDGTVQGLRPKKHNKAAKVSEWEAQWMEASRKK